MHHPPSTFCLGSGLELGALARESCAPRTSSRETTLSTEVTLRSLRNGGSTAHVFHREADRPAEEPSREAGNWVSGQMSICRACVGRSVTSSSRPQPPSSYLSRNPRPAATRPTAPLPLPHLLCVPLSEGSRGSHNATKEDQTRLSFQTSDFNCSCTKT